MNDFNELINGSKPVLVDFYATWCGPCQMQAPILEDVKQRLGDSVSVVKIDVDRNSEAAAMYNVRSIPTLMLSRMANGCGEAPDCIKLRISSPRCTSI